MSVNGSRGATRYITTLGVSACLVWGAAACGGSGTTTDPEPRGSASSQATEPTPTPTPSVDPVEAAKDLDITEAQAAYEAYIAKINEVEKAGTVGWEELLPLLGSLEMLEEKTSYYPQALAHGVVQTGDRVVGAFSAVEHIPDPTGSGHQQVRFDVCVDLTNVELIGSEGMSLFPPDYLRRQLTEVLMQRQQSGVWTVSTEDVNDSTSC